MAPSVLVERGVALLEVARDVAQQDQLALDLGEPGRARLAGAPLDLGEQRPHALERLAPPRAHRRRHRLDLAELAALARLRELLALLEELVVAARDALAREQVLGPRRVALEQRVRIVQRARLRQRDDALGRRRRGEAIRVELLAALEERPLELRRIEIVPRRQPELPE